MTEEKKEFDPIEFADTHLVQLIAISKDPQTPKSLGVVLTALSVTIVLQREILKRLPPENKIITPSNTHTIQP